ncbi:oxidoreductase [Chitinimonas naiadis]
MNKILQVGLVGYGYAGRTFHAPLIHGTPGCELTLIASSQPDLVQTGYPGLPVAPNPAALLARPDIDLVVLATPNDSHYPLALAALQAGKHVVVDKPFTLTAAEAQSLLDAAQQHQRLLSVFHNRRWDADFLLLQQLLEAGALGRISQFESRFDRFRPQVRQRWREADMPGAGIWFDLGPHLIDQALCLFGRPDAISADIRIRRDDGQSADDALAVLHYPDMRVILAASCLVAGGAPRFLLHGTRGSLAIHGLDAQEEQLKQGLRPGQPGWAKDPRQAVWYRETEQASLSLPDGAYTRYYAGVRDAILGHGPNPVPPEQALQVMQLIEAGLASSASGQRLALP